MYYHNYYQAPVERVERVYHHSPIRRVERVYNHSPIRQVERVYHPLNRQNEVKTVYHRPSVHTEKVVTTRKSIPRVTRVSYSPAPVKRVSHVSVTRPSYVPPVTTEIKRASFRPSRTTYRSERVVGAPVVRNSNLHCTCSRVGAEYGTNCGNDLHCSICGRKYETTTTKTYVEPVRTSYVRSSIPIRKSIGSVRYSEPVVKSVRKSLTRSSQHHGGTNVIRR